MAEIRLTTGGIGTGKSYKNVKDAYELLQQGDKCKYKKIYSNIRAHSELCEGITLLPDDWRECDPYSLIIIDECQSHEKFSKHFSNRRDSEIVDLTMIRHNHCDMWLISPNPTLVNKDVRDLVNDHICLEANGSKTTKAYCFDKVQLNLSKSVKLRAYDEFTYTIEPKYHAMYKSTKDGVPSERKYNRNIKLISFITGLIFVTFIIIALVFWLMSRTKDQVHEMQKNETKQQVHDSTKNVDIGVLPATTKLTDEDCRKGINVEKPECVEYFKKLTDNRMSVSDSSVEYKPSNPYDVEEIQKSVRYEVTQKPVFSGCMKKGSKYYAYSQQGTLLTVSDSDCKRLLDDGDRPFNYFATDNRGAIQNSSNQSQIYTELSQVAQLDRTQANNYVDPHLQQRVVNGSNSL